MRSSFRYGLCQCLDTRGVVLVLCIQRLKQEYRRDYTLTETNVGLDLFKALEILYKILNKTQICQISELFHTIRYLYTRHSLLKFFLCFHLTGSAYSIFYKHMFIFIITYRRKRCGNGTHISYHRSLFSSK